MNDNQIQKKANVPTLRFPEFSGEWSHGKLSDYLAVHPERNNNSEFSKEEVLSVSGDSGVVNQIELLGRSFAGKDVSNYHVVRKGNIIYTKSPLKEFPYGIVKMNKGDDGIVSPCMPYTMLNQHQEVNLLNSILLTHREPIAILNL